MTPAPTELTGNDYVSVPSIGADGAIESVNVVHGGLGGLVEWTGNGQDEPLLRPELLVDDVPVSLTALSWQRLDRWIPVFQMRLPDGLALHGTICAPGGYPSGRGFVIRFELNNRSGAQRQIRLRLHIALRSTKLWVATGRPLPGANWLMVEDGVLTLDSDAGRGPALAIGTSHAPSFGSTRDDASTLPAGARVEAANGELLHAFVEQSFSVPSQRRAVATFYVGVGRERDGARASVTALRRPGPEFWIRQARLELSHIVRAGEDPQHAELFNRNLVFNRYFAVARGIDDDALYLLRSRSTRCPAPALFNEREALFWTVPALILADPGLAREAIFRVFDSISERSGEYLRYIDGGAYDNAFVLDQLALYTWIADHYVRATGDETLLDEPLLRQVIVEGDTALFLRLHPQYMLCATDLLASGDQADHTYSTFGNVLVWAFCDALQRLWTRVPDEPPLRLEGAAQEVSAAIWQHCTTDVEGMTVLASSANLAGEAAVYDDPAGSLALLPFFGFCAADDPLWTDTMAFLRSRRYPLWRDGAVPGLATRSDPAHARLAALCADLLGPQATDALRRLTLLPLPGGVAAGGYTTDGNDIIEPYHAALAGFVAWAMPRANDRTVEKRRDTRSK